MSLQTAVNERILQRILDEAIRRGDVTVTLDSEGVPRFSVAPREPAVSLNPR